MIVFTVLKIAIGSLLIIYLVHLLWGYYTKDIKRDDEERTNSALHNSKRMYEEMARTIQTGEQIHTIDTSNTNISNTIEELSQPIISDNMQPLNILHEPIRDNDMQKELQAFMSNLT